MWADKARRKLTISSYDEKASGTSAKGVEWKLYEAACADETGDLVDAKLKTFQDAEKLAGKLVEFEVERQDGERYGTSYLLDLPRRASNRGGGVKDSVRQLHARVEQRKPSSPSWLELGASQLTLRRDGSPRLPSRMSARDPPLPPRRTGAASDDRRSLPLPGGRMKGPPYALRRPSSSRPLPLTRDCSWSSRPSSTTPGSCGR